MIYLIGSIILTSYLTLSFKVLERLHIPVLQSIVVNYWVCVAGGLIVGSSSGRESAIIGSPWLWIAIVLGCLFISLFNLIAFIAQHIGVAVASVANKMSLVIPFLFSIYLYKESVGLWQILGVLLALVAVWLTCLPGTGKLTGTGSRKGLLLMPVILFIGSGLLDTGVKYAEQTYLNEGNKDIFLTMAFGTAALLGLVLLLILFITGKQKPDVRALIAGVAIGIPNYFSIWCLVRVLSDYNGRSAAIIPINNMGIVLFSTLVAMLLFQERLTKTNWTGIIMALAAIALIAFG